MSYADKTKRNEAVARWKKAHPEKMKEWNQMAIAKARTRRAEERAQRAKALASAARLVERAKELARIALYGEAA
jgi:ferric-dicitrate binding protein FerR (iron transport regulator)